SLNAKNSLTTADARLVEDAFRDKIASFEDENSDSEKSLGYCGDSSSPGQRKLPKAQPFSLANGRRQERAVVTRNRRLRDNTTSNGCPTSLPHMRAATVRSSSSSVRAAASARAQGQRRVYCPPMRAHHREVHRCSDEVGWWTQAGIDPLLAGYPSIATISWREVRCSVTRVCGTNACLLQPDPYSRSISSSETLSASEPPQPEPAGSETALRRDSRLFLRPTVS